MTQKLLETFIPQLQMTVGAALRSKSPEAKELLERFGISSVGRSVALDLNNPFLDPFGLFARIREPFKTFFPHRNLLYIPLDLEPPALEDTRIYGEVEPSLLFTVYDSFGRVPLLLKKGAKKFRSFFGDLNG